MTVIVHENAGNLPCPISRTFSDPQKHCRGSECVLWRWIPLLSTDAEFKAAVSKVMDAEGSGHQKAVAAVMGDRAAHGLPDAPYRGFCGLGGRPTDAEWVGS